MEQLGSLQFERTIGSGTFGKVRRAIHLPTGKPVAVKILNKQRILNKKDALRIQREITILKRINHPNLLKLLQLVETPKSFMLVTQLVEGEQLYQRINRKGGLDQQEAGLWFVQLIDGILHLKNKGIAHRDIKPENIIIQGNRLTLIDYGLGTLYTQGQKLNTSCGSQCYAAPEMMNGKDYDPQKTEIWALGITLYAMLSGKLPFEEENPSKLLRQMLANNYEELPSISSALKGLLRGMIEAKPAKRMTLKQICNHKWLKAMQHQFIEQGIKNWDEQLLKAMSCEFGLDKATLIWRIQEGFGQESISYFLRKGQQRQEIPFHSGPIHLKLIFKSLELAQDYVNEQFPECKWRSIHEAMGAGKGIRIKRIRGGFFYVCYQIFD